MDREEFERRFIEGHQAYLDRWPPELRPEREALLDVRRRSLLAIDRFVKAQVALKQLEEQPEAERDAALIEQARAGLEEMNKRKMEIWREGFKLDSDYKEKLKAYGPAP